MLDHHRRIVQIAPVEHDRILHQRAQAIQIERRKIFPLGQDQQRIRASGGRIRIGGELDVRFQHFFRPLHGRGIVGANVTALAQQFLHQQQRRRLANIVRATFERQSQHAQPLAAESPEHAPHFAQEAVPLIFIDANYFFQQPEVVSAFLGDCPKRHQVFWKA